MAATSLLSGCGSRAVLHNVQNTVAESPSTDDVATSSTDSPTTDTAPPQTEGLIAATHVGCARLGALVLNYMLTGDTGGDALLGQALADARARLLAQPGEARAGLAQQQADEQITYCNDRQTKAENAVFHRSAAPRSGATVTSFDLETVSGRMSPSPGE